MKVAITGATGFIGKYLVEYLIKYSYEVLVLARIEENAIEYFNNAVNIYQTDYQYKDLTQAFQGVDAVIHLAAQTMQRDTDPLRLSMFFEVNIKLTEDVILAANKCNVKQVIQMSSNGVYSCANNLPFKEDDNPIPSNIYGLSKVTSEKIGEFISQQTQLNVISLRLARVFGYGERDSVVFTKYMKLISKNEPIEVWGKGLTSVDYIYVKDCVEAIEIVLRKKIPSGIYNVGSNNSFSVKKIAETINDVYENKINIIYDETRVENGSIIQMNSNKFYSATSWKPKWALKEAVRDMQLLYKH